MNQAQIRRAIRKMMSQSTISKLPTLDVNDAYPAFSFLFKDSWSLSNLQPLWAKENLKKGARYVNV